MKPALSQVCSLNSPFEKDLQDYRAGQCPAVEIWLGKLENYLQSHTPEDVRGQLEELQLTAPVASFQGGLLDSQGEKRKQHWQTFERNLDRCRRIGIGTLVVALDVAGPLDQQTLDRTAVSLVQAADQAAEAGVRLAVEFQATSAFGNNLQTAAALVAEAARPNLGICFDAFHYYVGPSKFADLGYLTPDNLFHVQLCDISGLARELVTDADRILPGDGDIMLEPLVEHFRNIGYAGHVSVEVLNPQIWQVPALQFGEIAMTAIRRLLGEASME